MRTKRKPMTMYERRRMAKSPYIKHDKSSSLWIQHRKVVYLYWFKLLKHAELDEDFTVDWEKYESWGGKEVVMNTRFDDWWIEHWKPLFSFSKDDPTAAPFHTDMNPQILWMRTGVLIYERFLNSHRRDKWEVGCWVRKYELARGRSVPKPLTNAIDDLLTKGLTSDELEDMSVGQSNRMKRQHNIVRREDDMDLYGTAGQRQIASRSRVEEISTVDFDLKQDKKRVQEYVGRYQRETKRLMTNIASGSLDPNE